MPLGTQNLAQPKELDPEDRLFRHRLRPGWGIGLWVREEKNRRRLVFQDGTRRAFKPGYYHLLEPVDADAVDIPETFKNLVGEAEMLREEKPVDAKPPVMPFADQIAVFLHQYPGGFGGDDYIDGHRRPLVRKARKAHVERALKRAQSELEEGRLREMLAEGRHDEVHAATVEILRLTTLVAARRVRPLKDLDADARVQFVESLTELLYGEGRYRDRFDRWVSSLRDLGIQPNWALATVLPALVHPDKHVCVKRSVFKLQARAVLASRKVAKKVTARRYRDARKIARAVRERLEEADLQPRDMLDVRNFIWQTLRPKGRSLLDEIR